MEKSHKMCKKKVTKGGKLVKKSQTSEKKVTKSDKKWQTSEKS